MTDYEARDKLLEKENVRGTYIREEDGEEKLVVLVTKKVPESELDDDDIVDKVVEGRSTDVEEVNIPHLQDSHQERHRPAPGGVSIGNEQGNAGTMTFPWMKDEEGRDVTLSNRHVAGPGASVYQPSLMDGGESHDKIGEVVETSEFDTSGENVCDSALIELDDPEELEREEILEIGKLRGFREATYEVDTYKKSGRTSYITEAGLRGRDARVRVTYGSETLLFTGLDVYGYMSDPGDSGSAIGFESGDAGSVLGVEDEDGFYGTSLLFAGSDRITLGIPFSVVQDVHGKLTVVEEDDGNDGDDGDDGELPWWWDDFITIITRYARQWFSNKKSTSYTGLP